MFGGVWAKRIISRCYKIAAGAGVLAAAAAAERISNARRLRLADRRRGVWRQRREDVQGSVCWRTGRRK